MLVHHRVPSSLGFFNGFLAPIYTPGGGRQRGLEDLVKRNSAKVKIRTRTSDFTMESPESNVLTTRTPRLHLKVHIISFCVSIPSRVDELNKLACSQCMVLHSSIGRALQCERRGHGFESRWSPETPFFRATSELLKLRFNCDGHIFISFKESMPPILSITLRSQKTYLYLMEIQNDGPVLFAIITILFSGLAYATALDTW